MSAATWNLLLASFLCLAQPALAQDQPSLAPVGNALPTALPDVVFRAVMDRSVVLHLTDGSELVGRILAIEPDLLVIGDASTGQVMTMLRARVEQVRTLDAAPPFVATLDRERTESPAVPRRQRHFAINLGISPSIDLDLDYRLFHGFANLGLVLPLATKGSVWPFALGAGLGIPVDSSHPAFRLDVFGYGSVVWSVSKSEYYASGYSASAPIVAFGLGLGVHYTLANAFTVGLAVPVMGYSVTPAGSVYDGGTAQGIAFFFLASAEALPLGYLGYRF